MGHHPAALPDGRPSTWTGWTGTTWLGLLYDWPEPDEPDGPWRQGHLPLHPAAEEEAAVARAAHAAPHPPAELP